MRRKLFGLVVIIGGVALGLYVGGWIFFVGGIIDVIEQIRAPVLEVRATAIGVAKMIFAGFIGSLIGGILFLIGSFIRDN